MISVKIKKTNKKIQMQTRMKQLDSKQHKKVNEEILRH